MCGFVAIIQDTRIVDLVSARRALDTISHRGPDASGEWYEADVFLGHRRLSIIDLATGDQPMHSSDGRYVIVFNGEIYNFSNYVKSLMPAGRDSTPIQIPKSLSKDTVAGAPMSFIALTECLHL